MMKKNILCLLLLIAGVVLLSGCSGGNQAPSSPAASTLDVNTVFSKLSDLNKVENPRVVDEFSLLSLIHI